MMNLALLAKKLIDLVAKFLFGFLRRRSTPHWCQSEEERTSSSVLTVFAITKPSQTHISCFIYCILINLSSFS
jgi:hypothetical protein